MTGSINASSCRLPTYSPTPTIASKNAHLQPEHRATPNECLARTDMHKHTHGSAQVSACALHCPY
jgi:hypothetical protein